MNFELHLLTFKLSCGPVIVKLLILGCKCYIIIGYNASIIQNIFRVFAYKLLEKESFMLYFDTRMSFNIVSFDLVLCKDDSDLTSHMTLRIQVSGFCNFN